MKKAIIAVTAATILMASQAQAFLMTAPILVGGMIGLSANQGGNMARARIEKMNSDVKHQYLLDLYKGMGEAEALAKGCSSFYMGDLCQQFLITYKQDAEHGPYAKIVVTKFTEMCEKGYAGSEYLLSRPDCQTIGVEVPPEEKASFDPMDGNWD